MKIATAAYPIDWHDNFASYEAKLARWVEEAAQHGAQLLVFPEYGAMELPSLLGREHAGDLTRSIDLLGELLGQINAAYQKLAQKYGVTILGASMAIRVDNHTHPVNRAYLFHGDGRIDYQDKQIMTRFERDPWGIGGGDPLTLFEIDGIKTGILICYDSEFPLLGRRLVEEGAQMILCPSCTDALAGFTRVRIGAMARALEGQCITVHSPTVGSAPWSQAVDENVGAAGIYCPPDQGFPDTGILAAGELNQPGWVYGEVDFALVEAVRADGKVLNMMHWSEQLGPEQLGSGQLG